MRFSLAKYPYLAVSLLATLLAITVVLLGAYTRLKDAGLGCPDWPTCYGQITVPESSQALTKAQTAYPNATITPAKAWPEMIHRYFAGSLGLLILSLGVWAGLRRRSHSQQPLLIPIALIGLVVFQAMLGMWTVTWLLHPLVVMGHLIGGMSIASCLWWVSLRSMPQHAPNLALSPTLTITLKSLAILGICIVLGQIFLGGWTSANYASVVCPHFPYCQGSFMPHLDFANAFNLAKPIGTNYEGGTLSETAKVTIQMVHRYGAIITASFITLFGFFLTRLRQHRKLSLLGYLMLGIVTTQFFLGIANVDSGLALPIALAHNGGALTLLFTMVTLLHTLFHEAPLERN